MTFVPPSGAAPTGPISYKSLLQEHAHRLRKSTPHYSSERTDNGFVATVVVSQESGPSLHFTSSQPLPIMGAAEQDAAKVACTELGLI